MNLAFYTGDAAQNVWPQVEPILSNVPSGGDFVTADLLDLLKTERAVLGVVYLDDGVTMAGVFEFIHYPRLMAVNIIALAGARMGDAMALFWEGFREFCRSQGANVIEARCGDAMTRLLRRQGFEPTYQVVRQEI